MCSIYLLILHMWPFALCCNEQSSTLASQCADTSRMAFGRGSFVESWLSQLTKGAWGWWPSRGIGPPDRHSLIEPKRPSADKLKQINSGSNLRASSTVWAEFWLTCRFASISSKITRAANTTAKKVSGLVTCESDSQQGSKYTRREAWRNGTAANKVERRTGM